MQKEFAGSRFIFDTTQVGFRPPEVEIPRLHPKELLKIAWSIGLKSVSVTVDENEFTNYSLLEEDSDRLNIQIIQEIQCLHNGVFPNSMRLVETRLLFTFPLRISVLESVLTNPSFEQFLREVRRRFINQSISIRVIIDSDNSTITNRTLRQLQPYYDSIEFGFPYKHGLTEEEDILAIVKYLRDIQEVRIEQRSLIPPPSYNWSLHAFDFPDTIFERNDGQKHDIAVVIPAYNKQDVIRHVTTAILSQNLPTKKYEVIFVDDGSDDKTSEIILSVIRRDPLCHNVRLLRLNRSLKHAFGNHDFTAGRARNAAIRFANSDLLLFLDADMIAPPTLLARHLAEQHTYGGVVLMGNRERLSNNFRITEKSPPWTFNTNSLYTYLVPKQHGSVQEMLDRGIPWAELDPYPWLTCASCNVSIPKYVLELVGYFDPFGTLWSLDDTDLFYRLYKAGYPFHYSKESNAFHCWHPLEGENSERDYLFRIVTAIMFRKHLDIEILRANSYLFDWPLDLI